MMDGRVVEVPVVKKRVETPYCIGEVEGVAMKAPIYDLVIGNVHGERVQEDQDTSWEIYIYIYIVYLQLNCGYVHFNWRYLQFSE